MKRVILSIVCMMAFLGLQAQTNDYLTFQSTTGTEKSVLSVGTVITFSNNNLVAKNANEEYTIALSELSKFYFSDTASAIKTVANEVDGTVTVYTVSGQLVGRFDNKAAAQGQLTKGIYVVKGQGKSKKMMVE